MATCMITLHKNAQSKVKPFQSRLRKIYHYSTMVKNKKKYHKNGNSRHLVYIFSFFLLLRRSAKNHCVPCFISIFLTLFFVSSKINPTGRNPYNLILGLRGYMQLIHTATCTEILYLASGTDIVTSL